MSISELFPGRSGYVEAARARLYPLLDAEGLPHTDTDHVPNTRLAQELATWAQTHAGGDAIHNALFRAYFAQARDIGEIDELVTIASEVGLPADEARRVLTERTFRAAVDEDWALARQIGVTGVPTFVIGEQGVVGAQPLEVLQQLAEAAGARPR